MFDDSNLVLGESEHLSYLISHPVDVLGGVINRKGFAFPESDDNLGWSEGVESLSQMSSANTKAQAEAEAEICCAWAPT